MINEQVLEEVRGSVMRKLRRRRAGKLGLVASVAVALVALWMPVKQTKTEEGAAPPVTFVGQTVSPAITIVGQAVSPAIAQRVVISPVPHKAARVNKRSLPKPEPKPEAAPEGPQLAYIKILTDDPNVVFLLVSSEDGGTE